MATLKLINIEDRNEKTLIDQAKANAARISDGKLTSLFNVGDPLDVFVRSMAYVASELRYKVNQLPLQFVLRFLELTGVVQSEGTKARATCLFRLTSTRDLPFTLPAGYTVTGSYQGRSLSYKTVEVLTIAANQTTGTVIVEAEEIGSEYNVPSGIINKLSQPYSYLQSVVNIERSQGGNPVEPRDAVIKRGFAVIRRKSPISAIDYEEESQDILGYGSRAKAIGLLGLDKATFEKGAVHVFLLSTNGLPANTAETNKVRSVLGRRIQLGTRLHVSPMDTLDIQVEVIAELEEGANAESSADAVWQVFREQINPINYPLGQSVDTEELGHHFRFAEGIKFIEDVFINGDSLPIALPNDFTMPIAKGMLLHLVGDSGAVFDIVRGDGPVDPD